MVSFKNIWLILVFFISSLGLSAQKTQVFDEGQFKDDLQKEWCYLKKSCTAIGLPYQNNVTLVTYDGSLFNRINELNFYYGKQKKAVFARQKNFLDGWIPVVEYEWNESGIGYRLEMFAYTIDGFEVEGPVNFVKLTAKNISLRTTAAYLTVAARGRLLDGTRDELFSEFSTNRKLSMDDDLQVKLDENIIYFTDQKASSKYAIDGDLYRQPFLLSEKQIDVQTPFGASCFTRELATGESLSLTFKTSMNPVCADSDFSKAIQKADYNSYRSKTVDFWKKTICSKTIYSIPEKRINDCYKASLVHVLLATRSRNGSKIQTDGVPYPNFFLTSAPQSTLAYLQSGNFEMAKQIIRKAVIQQEPDGLFFDKSLAHGGIIPAAHGHVMYMIGEYWMYTHDREFLNEIFGVLSKAVEYIRISIENDDYGLLPPTYQYDNEMIDGHYASNNYWTLLGLRQAVRIASDLGKNDIADSWRKLEQVYSENILKGVEASVREDGYVPTGLYDYIVGKNAKRHFDYLASDNDWENMLLAYPIELLEPLHKYVEGTLKRIRKGYGEGIMTYRHGLHLHQYITANMIEQYLARGETKTALTDYYHLLLHSGSTHEGFENMVWPWQNRELISVLPPHAWASAKIAVLTRNLLIYEYGGKCGMNKDRDLYLMSVLSPEWMKNGDTIKIKNAPCEMGMVNASLTTKNNKSVLTLNASFTNAPRSIKFRIPYFKKLKSFKSDDKGAHLEGDCIVLSPDFTKLTITWKNNPEAFVDNFAAILEDYRACNLFLDADFKNERKPIIREGKAFLKPGEKIGRKDTLNFNLVRKTFLYEMGRRHNEDTIPDYSAF